MPAANSKLDKSIPAGRYKDASTSVKVWELERPLKILDFDTEDELNFGLDRYGKRRNSHISDASREEGETSSSFASASLTSSSGDERKRRPKASKDRRKRSSRLYSSSGSSARDAPRRAGGRRRSSSYYSSDGEDSIPRVMTHPGVTTAKAEPPLSAEVLRKLQIA